MEREHVTERERGAHTLFDGLMVLMVFEGGFNGGVWF